MRVWVHSISLLTQQRTNACLPFNLAQGSGLSLFVHTASPTARNSSAVYRILPSTLIDCISLSEQALSLSVQSGNQITPSQALGTSSSSTKGHHKTGGSGTEAALVPETKVIRPGTTASALLNPKCLQVTTAPLKAPETTKQGASSSQPPSPSRGRTDSEAAVATSLLSAAAAAAVAATAAAAPVQGGSSQPVAGVSKTAGGSTKTAAPKAAQVRRQAAAPSRFALLLDSDCEGSESDSDSDDS